MFLSVNLVEGTFYFSSQMSENGFPQSGNCPTLQGVGTCPPAPWARWACSAHGAHGPIWSDGTLLTGALLQHLCTSAPRGVTPNHIPSATLTGSFA